MHYVQPCFTDSIVRNVTPQQIKDFQKTREAYFYITQMGNHEFSLEVRKRIRGGGPGFGGFMYVVTKSLCYGILALGAGSGIAAGGSAIIGTIGATSGGATAVTVGAATGMAATTVEGAIIGTAAATTLTGGVIAGSGTALASAAAGTTSAAIPTMIVTTAGVGIAVAGTAGAVGSGAGLVTAGMAAASSLGGATVGGIALTEAAQITTVAVVNHATSTAGVVGGIGLITGGIEALSIAVGTFFGMMPTP